MPMRARPSRTSSAYRRALVRYERPRLAALVDRLPCDPDRDYLKRVVATSGDTVKVRCSAARRVLDSRGIRKSSTPDTSYHSPMRWCCSILLLAACHGGIGQSSGTTPRPTAGIRIALRTTSADAERLTRQMFALGFSDAM